MKNLFYIVFILVLLFPSISLTQDISDSAKAVVENRINLINQKIIEKGYRWKAGITSKSYLTKEEMSKLCGLKGDTSKFKGKLQKSDSLYQDYKIKKRSDLHKTLTLPDWQGMMSDIEDQECYNCWAHAATSVTIGLLHNFYGSNIGIDLDEMDITDNATCGDCYGTYYLDCGLSHIYNSKVRSEQWIDQFPNYDHAYYTVSSYSNNSASISAIKESIESSPVLAGMAVYTDFQDYEEGIYEHTSGDFVGYHAVVILGYNDENEYWLCRNSWGTGWGEAGYFRIAYGECGIDAMGNVTASISGEDCFAKLIPNFNALSDAMEYAFVDDEWAYILNNITINNGDNVNVPSNTFLAFTNNITLTINGSLYINGTYSNPVSINRFSVSGSFGGITIGNGGSADIDYANIQNATTGVKFESGSSGSVSNSTLSNNTYGIYVTSAEPTIESNTINSNSYGIYVTNSYSSSWTVEHIKNNSIQSNSAYGIYLYNSSPTLSSNAVSGCNNGTALFTNCNSKVYDNDFVSNSSYGFACYGSSSPSVYYNTNYSFGGYNSVLSNGSDEVRITGSSNPNFGNYFFDGNNSFDDNSGYLIYNSTGSTISAENNWWGSSSGPGVNQIYGSVDYDPYLDEDPNNPSRAVFIDNPSLAVSSVNSTENLSNAFNAYYGGNFTLAASLFKEYLNQNPKSESALEIIQYYLQSLNMYKSRTDMLSDIDILLRLKLNDAVRNEVISLYAAHLELNGNYDEALLQLESLIGKETEGEFKNRVKLQKAYLLINSKKDTESAKALFEEVLQNTSDDSYLFEIASAELNNLSGTRSAFAQPLEKKADSNEEKNTFWLKNYPNPFNAETVIKFSLANESDVEIIVYNILGQRITTLVNDKLPAGQHNVKLNAANFASGIYFVTFTLKTGSESQTIKVSLMK